MQPRPLQATRSPPALGRRVDDATCVPFPPRVLSTAPQTSIGASSPRVRLPPPAATPLQRTFNTARPWPIRDASLTAGCIDAVSAWATGNPARAGDRARVPGAEAAARGR